MSEAMVLLLVARYPHPAALARHSDPATSSRGLARLQRAGLVSRRGGIYRLTRRGRLELELAWALRKATARAWSGG